MTKKLHLGKWLKRLFYFLLVSFIFSNFVIYNHAYRFTHFSTKDLKKVTVDAINQKSWSEKLQLAIYGVEVPKSHNNETPKDDYNVITLGEKPQLNAWWIPTSKPPKGVFICFHGYSACKAAHINEAKVLRSLGYHTFLVDFRGHGDSEGTQTSIGFHEAKDVLTAYQYVQRYYDELPISLMGTSMGSVSILKAVHDYQLDAAHLIIECPFESLRTAVYSRFENMKLPTFVLPELLLFWGGWQNDMNGFAHNAANYATKVSVPTLVLYGKNDTKVRRSEVDAVFNALAGKRQFVVLEDAGHDHMMEDDRAAWTKAVWSFLE